MVGLGSADGIGADGLPAGCGRPGDDGRRIGVDGDVIEGSEGMAVGRLALVDLVTWTVPRGPPPQLTVMELVWLPVKEVAPERVQT
jgi:hypothetical protein